MRSHRFHVSSHSAANVHMSVEDLALLGMMRRANAECRDLVMRSQATIASTLADIDLLDQLARYNEKSRP
jgi:hypothetical protein